MFCRSKPKFRTYAMMFKGSTLRWSAFGIALILTAALFASSCCSHRNARERKQTAQQLSTQSQTETHGEEKHEATLRRTTCSRGVTLTEIEFFDLERPADPTTGQSPLKARIRQTHATENLGNEASTMTSESLTATATQAEQTYCGGTLEELEVTATKKPSLWDRVKQGAAWAAAIIILATAIWITFKLKNHKNK